MLHVACWKPTTEHADQTCRDPADFLLYIIVIIENSFFPVISLHAAQKHVIIHCMHAITVVDIPHTQPE